MFKRGSKSTQGTRTAEVTGTTFGMPKSREQSGTRVQFTVTDSATGRTQHCEMDAAEYRREWGN